MTMPSSHRSFQTTPNATSVTTGVEWVVDAGRCDPEKLCNLSLILSVCDRVVQDLGLQVVGAPLTHKFPSPGGVTALYLLSESHLACHTYPEHSLATFNLYCCRDRAPWDWQGVLADSLSTGDVSVRRLDRGAR